MKTIVFFMSILFSANMFAQNLDLIVTYKGDSLACKIDSLTDKLIYVQLRQNGRWVDTFVEKEKAPVIEHNAIDKKLYIFKPGTSQIIGLKEETDLTTGNPFGFRHNFGPSSHNLKKGEGCYTTWYLMEHEVQYALSNKLNLGAGTTLVGIPFYLMANYAIPVSEKSSFAIGDLFLCAPVSDLELYSNLLYGMYTRGTSQKNVSFGMGLWTTKDVNKWGLSARTISPAFCIATQLKTASDHWYFLSENYFFRLNVNDNAEYIAMNIDYDINELYIVHQDVAFGLSGFRYISKRNPRRSWNFCFLYVYTHNSAPPQKYNQMNWEINAKPNTSFIAFPFLSYSWKFGNKK